MLPYNVDRVLDIVKPDDRVLDIGGWYIPFTRADYVIDIGPYSTRAPEGKSDGPLPERFDESTWIQRDICAREPYPFEDKEIDFAIASHVLEDVRDPIFVCSELMRVAKRGYIETPSFDCELTFGFMSREYAGYTHHRWLCEYGPNRIEFVHKPHHIHAEWRSHFPETYRERLGDEQAHSFLFWEDGFEFSEDVRTGMDGWRDIERRVREHGGYPEWRYRVGPIGDATRTFLRKVRLRADRVLYR